MPHRSPMSILKRALARLSNLKRLKTVTGSVGVST